MEHAIDESLFFHKRYNPKDYTPEHVTGTNSEPEEVHKDGFENLPPYPQVTLRSGSSVTVNDATTISGSVYNFIQHYFSLRNLARE